MESVVKPWILAARPKTLGAAVAPVLVGTALGSKLSGQLCISLALAALGSCIALQIATNLFNDAVDALKGSDTGERLGPTRITASGMMPATTVMKVAAGVLVIAVLLALPLLIYRGWPILAIGIPSLWFCYGYTGGPMPLAYRGLGELFVVLFFGLVAVTGSAFVQSGQWHFEAVVAGLQIGMLSTVLIAINNLRDIEEDSKTGKRTLAVRYGKRFARREVTLLLILALGIFCYWQWLGLHSSRRIARGFLPVPWVLLSILAGHIIGALYKSEPSAVYNKLLAKAGALLVLSSVVLCIFFWLF